MNNIWRNHTVFCYNWRTPRGFFGNLFRIPRGIKWSWQRVMRGFADCDMWNFDRFLANAMIAGFRGLAADNHTYPYEYGTPEEWNKKLLETADKIEYGIDGSWVNLEDYKERRAVLKEALDWVGENFEDLWD